MNKSKSSSLGFLILFLFFSYLMWLMARPFITPIILGAILSGTTYSLFQEALKKAKIKREFLGILFILMIILVIVIPLTYILFQLSKETITLYQVFRTELNDGNIHAFLFGDGTIPTFFKKALDTFNINLDLISLKEELLSNIKSISSHLVTFVNGQISNTFNLAFQFIIMLLATYSFYVYGPSIKRYTFNLSPLPENHEELILTKFNQMNYVTLFCNGLGGIIQGILAGTGLLFAGIESIFLWTFLMVILAFIPLVGISLIYVPVCIYLWLKGSLMKAIILFVYCTLVSLVTENYCKPKFIGKRIQMNSMFILFLIIGGMSAFGMAGIFYGPIIGILFLTVVELYHEYYVPIWNKEN